MDLVYGHALVGMMEHLVVKVGVHVALVTHDLLDPRVAPTRPAVRREHHLNLGAEAIKGLVGEIGPCLGVARFRTAQRVKVVQGGDHVFGGPERLVAGKPGIHLSGSLCTGGTLENHLDTVHRHFFIRLGNHLGRRYNARIALGRELAD